MHLLRGSVILILFVMVVGCAGTKRAKEAKIENYRQNYSIEVVGSTDTIMSIPEGVNVNNVSKAISNEVIARLATNGLTTNKNKKRFKLKYNISYLGHEWGSTFFMWKRTFHAKYIIKYTIQLMDENTGSMIASKKNDKDDEDLTHAAEDVAHDIFNFAMDNIK